MDLSLDQIVRDNARDTPQDTVEAVIAAIGLPRKWATMLRPALLDYCRQLMRFGAIAAEREYMHAAVANGKGKMSPSAAKGSGSEPTDSLLTMPELRSEFLRTRFATSDGRFVQWAEATVADHQMRLGMLLAQRKGLNRTIDLHERAVGIILSADVKCLGDLSDFDLDSFLSEAP